MTALRLELLVAGRSLRLSLRPQWRFWAAWACGVGLVECGPLTVSVSCRRTWGWR